MGRVVNTNDAFQQPDQISDEKLIKKLNRILSELARKGPVFTYIKCEFDAQTIYRFSSAEFEGEMIMTEKYIRGVDSVGYIAMRILLYFTNDHEIFD